MGGDSHRTTLGEAADLLTGFPFKSADFTERQGDVRLLRGDNIGQGSLRWDGAKRWPNARIDEVKEYLLRPGDVVLAMDRPWIEAGLKHATLTEADCPSLLVQRVARLRARLGIDQRFLGYVIQSFDFTNYVLGVQTGTAVPHISGSQIKGYRFELPPLGQQQAISELLGALDDRIELNRRMAETLEVMARALFKSWFVDFDPVRAKSGGRLTGLTDELADLFPRRLGEAGLPEGWRYVPLLQHARLISGGTPKTDIPEYWDGSIPWASAKDVSQCTDLFLSGTERTISDLGLENSATRIIPKLSVVVVARGATTGRFRLLSRDMAMNQTCYALQSRNQRPFWLASAFGELVGTLLQAAHGSVFDTITTATLERTRVIAASDPLMDRFEKAVAPIYERLLGTSEQSNTLAQLRDALLPKLISGELRIADGEKRTAVA